MLFVEQPGIVFKVEPRSLVLSLWKVNDTALLMQRFYESPLGALQDLKQALPKARALHEAKRWLRELTAAERDARVKDLPGGGRGRIEPLARPPVSPALRPYAHPYYWAAFILIGDPY
jgi:CHAT domain-containing protein